MAYQTIKLTDPPDSRSNTLLVEFDTRQVRAHFIFFTFEDHGHIVCYIPSLNLSSYGSTVEEAREMLVDVVLDDFCENLVRLSKSAAFEYLSKLGWRVKGQQAQAFENASYIDKEGVLRNFDLPQDTPIEEQLVTV